MQQTSSCSSLFLSVFFNNSAEHPLSLLWSVTSYGKSYNGYSFARIPGNAEHDLVGVTLVNNSATLTLCATAQTGEPCKWL
uniref:Uncharacterized protein n=1 Tax=Anser brachyrhynchus TaxID=132585 RepID=A0A8B9BFX8_9AVES